MLKYNAIREVVKMQKAMKEKVELGIDERQYSVYTFGMQTLTEVFPNTEHGTVPAKEVAEGIHQVLKVLHVSKRVLAHGLGLSESFLNRMLTRKKGTYKAETLRPLRRAARLIEETQKTLSPEGVPFWLNHPNPYLNNLPPVMCMRSDAEVDRALTQLYAIRYGMPA
jgi:hypothetical protein